MAKEINEKILRINGGASLPPDTEMVLGEEKEVKVQGSIIKVEEKDNQDGTRDIVYILKIITAEIC